MKEMVLFTLAGAAAALSAAAMAACGTTSTVMPGAGVSYEDAAAPKFAPATVHDPSVFPVGDGQFYVIGSHLASASTKDFIQWKQLTLDWNSRPNMFYPVDGADPSVQKVRAQIADVMRGAQNDLGFFASDVHRMPNGKFYHYYSITASWYCSAIGLAVADTVEGPYVTRGLIVRSGEANTGSKSPDGARAWSQARHPNCIDPQAFFDEQGHFYLAYGSWSGGIFLLELDPDTGLLKAGVPGNAENDGYGVKLIRNNHVGIEGPFIIYSPESRYYYLFTSFGALHAEGGYNIRVFRSRDAAGPYEDAAHQNVGAEMKAKDITQYGVKLMGGYQFRKAAGESGLMTTGFLSPGHNSAWRDPESGRYFILYHQRFVGRGEYHEVRAAEFFINEDGWPVIAPFRWDGGSVRTFTKEALVGTWKLLNHGRDNNTTPHESVTCVFAEDGSISGAASGGAGTWSLGADGKTAHITVGGVPYKGVFLRQWDGDRGMWVQAFTALSADGTALWGAGAAVKTK
ncbi:MAG: glycoside hydrolase family 43 protein [Treponema sp.]|jgi:arabinan endo-1,5-alpha-L-arabinosidase|nr:glycoside hydrolase family 43 protein [Treponema sp.]